MITYEKEIKLSRTNGYQVFCDMEHPLVNSSGWIYYHRHVASLKVGHWLTTEEHVHHIDGNRLNNDPSNLEVMSQSDHSKEHHPQKIRRKKCKICGKYTYKKGSREYHKQFCSDDCRKTVFADGKNKIVWPTPEEMSRLVWEKPTQQLAKELGVSDVAIAKFCKKHLIKKPERGYWMKLNALTK